MRNIGNFVLVLIWGFCAVSASAAESKIITCTGTVIDEQDKPLAGAQVELYGVTGWLSQQGDPVQKAVTQADGAFTFTPGDERKKYQTFIIVARKEGLALGWANWQQTNKNFEVKIRLGPPKALAGVVVNEQDQPIADAEVGIYAASVGEGQNRRYLIRGWGSIFFTAHTDAAGKFRLENLPGGATAELIAQKPGMAVTCTFDLQQSSRGELQYAAGHENIKIVLKPEAIIEGRVVQQQTQTPVSGVSVVAMTSQGSPAFGLKPVPVGQDGSFRIAGMTAGTFKVQLTTQLYGPKTSEPAEWIGTPVDVTTEAGKTAKDVLVPVSKGGMLEVTVVTEDDKKPVEDAQVTIHQQNTNRRYQGITNTAGVAKIRLLPGEYDQVQAYKEGLTNAQSGSSLALEDGKTARLELAMQSQPKVSGVILDPAGKPVAKAKIMICPFFGPQESQTDSQGQFEVTWDPRGWGGQQPACYLIVRDEDQNLAAAMEIDDGQKEMQVKLSQGITIIGIAVDPQNKPLAGAKARMMFRTDRYGSVLGNWEKGMAISAADGTFSVNAIPIGQKYQLDVTADGYGKATQQIQADDAVDNKIDMGKLTLAVANLNITGIVIDQEDKPVARAQVNGWEEGQPDRHGIKTDSDGRFIIKDVCAGRMGVNAWVEGKNLHGQAETEGGATDVKITVSEQGQRRYTPAKLTALTGKKLPGWDNIKFEADPAGLDGKRLLICFFDMNQRPSRQAIKQLVQQAEQLKQKDITAIAVQAEPVEADALKAWREQSQVAFPVGLITADAEKTRAAWGVGALPWLILTDKDHAVCGEGFGMNELEQKTAMTEGK